MRISGHHGRQRLTALDWLDTPQQEALYARASATCSSDALANVTPPKDVERTDEPFMGSLLGDRAWLNCMWSSWKSARSMCTTGTRLSLSLSSSHRALLLVLVFSIPFPDTCFGPLRLWSQYRISLMRGSPDFVAQYDLDMVGASHEVITALAVPHNASRLAFLYSSSPNRSDTCHCQHQRNGGGGSDPEIEQATRALEEERHNLQVVEDALLREV